MPRQRLDSDDNEPEAGYLSRHRESFEGVLDAMPELCGGRSAFLCSGDCDNCPGRTNTMAEEDEG